MPTTSQREARRAAIMDLLQARPMPSQGALSAALAAAGHDVNQATLSRDLRAIGARKGPEGYVLPGSEGPDPSSSLARLRVALGQWCKGLDQAQQLLVLRTPPSGAQPLAYALDAARPTGLLGTIAGDDTVLVITPDASKAKALSARLTELLP